MTAYTSVIMRHNKSPICSNRMINCMAQKDIETLLITFVSFAVIYKTGRTRNKTVICIRTDFA